MLGVRSAKHKVQRGHLSHARRKPLVRHRDETPAADWAFGQMQRIVTGGEGGVANVHVAKTNGLPPFFHTGYDEVYYVLSGTGTVTLNGRNSHCGLAASLLSRQACHMHWKSIRGRNWSS